MAESSTHDPNMVETTTNDFAAATEEILSKTSIDALLNVSEDALVGYDPEVELVKAGAHRPGCWVHPPGRVEFLAVADRRLTHVAKLNGQSIKKVERVRPLLIKGTKLLVLKAATTNDLTAVPVHRYAGSTSAWVNLISLLGAAGLTVQTGYRERFDVAFIPQGSPLFPGLVMDLSHPIERRRESQKKKKAPGEAANPSAAESATTASATSPTESASD